MTNGLHPHSHPMMNQQPTSQNHQQSPQMAQCPPRGSNNPGGDPNNNGLATSQGNYVAKTNGQVMSLGATS